METGKQIILNRWFVISIAVGFFSLGASLVAIYVFDLTPCTMCLIQRIPFALLILNGVFGLVGPYKQGFFRVIQGVLVLGIVLGGVHFLMQIGAFPDFCSSQRGFSTPEEFFKSLQSSRCSALTWSMFGIPISLLCVMIHGLFLGMSIRLKTKLIRGKA